MLIAQAFASEPPAAPMEGATQAPADPLLPPPPTPAEAFMWNMGLVLVLVVMFYLLLIRPQQRRFKDHRDMIGALKKGDRVVAGGGLIGTIDTLVNDREVVVDLGNGLKVTALRSSLQGHEDVLLKKTPEKAKTETLEKKTPPKK